MSRAADAVIIGSGHNALVAAAYLARAGWGVEVIERAEQPGGAVITEEPTGRCPSSPNGSRVCRHTREASDGLAPPPGGHGGSGAVAAAPASPGLSV
jgi:monoamine oxidase